MLLLDDTDDYSAVHVMLPSSLLPSFLLFLYSSVLEDLEMYRLDALLDRSRQEADMITDVERLGTVHR